MNRSYNAFRLQFFQRRFHNIDPLNGLRIRCSRAPCAALRCARLSGSCRRRAGGLRLMAGRTRLSRVTRLASRGGRSGRMFRSGARSALHRSPLLRDAARGARARVPDCVLRLRPPARHRFPSRRHERHPRQGLSASESLKLRALRPHAFRTDSRPSASLKLLFSETHKMEMTHYMELMMGSWHMLVLFMAAPMLLAECYVVSEILLLIKPPQGGALAAFNKASAYAAALGIALLSGCVAFSSRRSSHGAPGSTPFRPSPTWPRAFRSSTSAFSRRPRRPQQDGRLEGTLGRRGGGRLSRPLPRRHGLRDVRSRAVRLAGFGRHAHDARRSRDA